MKTIEDVNEKDMRFVLDQLSNSMEFYASSEEFAGHISSQTEFSYKELTSIFNEYWKLTPTQRMNFGFDIEDGEDFVLNIINNLI